jgi:hypothetical protein
VDIRYAYATTASTFDIRRARVLFSGDFGHKFDYRLQVDFANSPQLLDASLRFKAKTWLNVEAGALKTLLSIENPYSPKELELMDLSPVVMKLVGYDDLAGIKASGCDIGLAVSGKLLKIKERYLLEYAVGIFNGNGINVKDNNKSKDISGRLQLYPVKNLTLSVSCYIGEMAVPQTDSKYARRDRYAFGLRYDNRYWKIRAEYIHGLTGIALTNAMVPEARPYILTRSDGAYLLLGYAFQQKIMPVGRIDFFREDIHDGQFEINYTAGCSYWIHQHVRCQLNFTCHTTAQNPNGTFAVMTMITAAF